MKLIKYLVTLCLIIGCSGSDSGGPKTTTISYWIEKNTRSHMYGYTPAQTRAKVRAAFRELGSICGATFVEKDNRSATIDITFHHQDKMHRGALGAMYISRGEMQLNNSRVVSKTKYPRLIELVVQHEMFHWFRRDSFHSKDKTSILWENGPNQGNFHMNASDRNYLVKKYGAAPVSVTRGVVKEIESFENGCGTP